MVATTISCRLACWKPAVLCLLLLWLNVADTGRVKPLYFSYITANSSSFVPSSGIPVVDLALQQINNRTDILPDHTLSYTTILDSQVITFCVKACTSSCYYMQCNRTTALDAFMEHFRGVSQPTYLSLLCCGCPTATIPVAKVSHYWNIPQVC